MRNERMPTVIGFMAASYLDLGDPPDHEEADRLQDQAGAHEPGPDRVGLEGVEVARVHELEDDREYRRAQPRADGRPAVLCRQHPGIAQDLEPLADPLG